MRACAVWLQHQHTAEENLLDRTGALRKDDEYCALCSSAADAVAVGHSAESLLISSLTGFLLPEM